MKYPTCSIIMPVKGSDEPILMPGIVIDRHLINVEGAHTVLHEVIDVNGEHLLLYSDELYYDYEELKAL